MIEYKHIRKNSVKNFLLKIQSDAHHLYALMAGLPKKNCYLLRYYDNANKIEGYDDLKNNVFTIQEFFERYDTIHPEDYFGIYFASHLDKIDSKRAEEYTDRIYIDKASKAIIPVLQEHINTFLESYCEECLRENRPLELTQENIDRFGFTPEDVERLRKTLTCNNTAAKKQILAEYEALCQLDFIRNYL